MSPQVPRFLNRLVVVLLLILLAVGVLAVQLVRSSYPTTSGEVRIPGLRQPVDVFRGGAVVGQAEFPVRVRLPQHRFHGFVQINFGSTGPGDGFYNDEEPGIGLESSVRYKIRFVNDGGNGPYSNVATAHLP